MVAVAQSLREQVASACRILAAEGYADLTLGHVSARGPDGDIWIKRKGIALGEVEPDDVGKDVPWAVLTAATLERAARLQSHAAALGELRPIGHELARQLFPSKYRDEFVEEYWAAWQRSVDRDRGGLGGDRA